MHILRNLLPKSMRRAAAFSAPARLFPIRTGEIAATQNDKHFKRIHGGTGKLAVSLNTSLGNPDEVSEVFKNKDGVTFTRRSSGSNKVWTFKESDLPAVAKLLGRGFDKSILGKIKPGEIATTNTDNNFKRIHGKTSELAKELNTLLGKPEKISEADNNKHGVLFTRRYKGSGRRVWTFMEADLPAVAALLKCNYDESILEQTNPGEIVVTGHDNHFQRIHGATNEVAKSLNTLLGKPNEASKVLNDEHGVIFTRRYKGPSKKVWTFRESDLPAVAKLLNRKYDKNILEQIKPGEIAASKNDDLFKRIHGTKHEVAKTLNTLLGDPTKVSEVINDEHGVLFTRRHKVNMKVWTFKESDLPAVAKLLGHGFDESLLEHIKTGEIAITGTDNHLKRIHGSTFEVARKLNAFLGNPEEVSEILNDEHGATFSRRYSSTSKNRKLWTFKREEWLKVCHLLYREGIINPDTFVGISQEVFGGDKVINAPFSINSFQSKEERKVALLLKLFGQIDTLQDGINCQIKSTKNSQHTFDFLIRTKRVNLEQKIIIEHHPDYHEDRKDKNQIEKEYLKLLERLDKRKQIDPDTINQLLGLFEDPQNASALKLLDRQINPNQRDLYDITRLVLMELNPKLHDCKYLRTRSTDDLFEHFIWPNFYKPQGRLSYQQAKRAFNEISENIDVVLDEHDPIVKKALFGVDGIKSKETFFSAEEDGVLTQLDGAAPFITDNSTGLTVTMLNVGQGEAFLLQTPDKKNILLDGGGHGETWYQADDAAAVIDPIGSKIVVPFLKEQQIEELDSIILSHPHVDHLGGLVEVVKALPVRQVISSGEVYDSDAYRMFAALVKQKRIKQLDPTVDRVFNFGRHLEATVLNSLSNNPARTNSDYNNNSLVIRFVFGNLSFLFTGDLEEEREAALLKYYSRKQLKSSVLKIAHHGSANSSSAKFLRAVKPQVALLSVNSNAHGHPHQSMLHRLEKQTPDIYRTDEDGTTILTTDGRILRVEKKHDRFRIY
ncbi:MAG: MBL fold metallo-hydrolase [Candidatus Saganbacteria bacterium]|nr:MBL fold metallo-hydrolase [Candidatus Saganbacteria bacterium]